MNGFGSSANWIFVPANRTYSSVNSTISGEDFIALLMGDVSGNWAPPSAGRQEMILSKQNFPAQECEGPTGGRIITSKAVCSAIAEARASATKLLSSRLSAGGSKKRPAGAGVLTSANRYPIMARKELQPPSAGGGPDRHTEIDRLIGESLLDYGHRREMEDMRRAKAKAKAEEELRKCLPKEGELPEWANDWAANVWQDGKSEIPSKRFEPLIVTDPADPNVMWRVGVNRSDPLRRMKGIDGCLFKSIDGGVKWIRLPYPYQQQWRYVSSLAATRENGKTILLAGVMGEWFSIASDSGIMRSDDGGDRWYRVCDGYARSRFLSIPTTPKTRSPRSSPRRASISTSLRSAA